MTHLQCKDCSECLGCDTKTQVCAVCSFSTSLQDAAARFTLTSSCFLYRIIIFSHGKELFFIAERKTNCLEAVVIKEGLKVKIITVFWRFSAPPLPKKFRCHGWIPVFCTSLQAWHYVTSYKLFFKKCDTFLWINAKKYPNLMK